MLPRPALARAIALAPLVAGALLASPVLAQRLPGDAVPSHYRVHLEPDLASGVLRGEETIAVDLPRAAASITLHAVGFELTAQATPAGGAVQPATVSADPAAETVRLAFDPPLPAGKATLALAFTGRLRDDLRGLYRIRVDGTTAGAASRWLAATQFEGTYARLMFPCFDEPQYKATFDLAVVAENGMTAISNGPLLRDEPGPGLERHTLTFATSPRMSTYLVALAIGDLACVEGGADGTPIRICALPEKKELGRFALAAAERFLHFYNGWYGIKYPFAKLDMIAFPEYEWGGMENTAAVFYKERALLVDPATASAQTRRSVAGVVAHEMAHQWFGDLVTMRWWDDVWLNEGFATWMAHKPLAAWDATWNQDVEATTSAQGVLVADALATTRPIRQNAATAAEIKELFDGVAYGKGAAMLRMVEGYVGEETFRAGVNAYLAAHANANATAEDFWSALATVSGKPVEKMLATFVGLPGEPLVSATLRCEGGATELRLRQQRFFLDPRALSAEHPEVWSIPVCFRAGEGGATRCELLDTRERTLRLDGCAPWVMLNAGGKGYYRVEYDPASLARLAAAAASLPPAERVALFQDQWALVRVGRAPIADFLKLAEGLAASRELPVLNLLVQRLQYVGRLVPEADRAAYRAWLASLLRPAARELGFTPPAEPAGETDDQRVLRALLLGALGEAGDTAAVAEADRLTALALTDASKVDPNLLAVALPVSAARGDAALYGRVEAAIRAARTPEQAFRFVLALASFEDPALVDRALARALDGSLRAQDLPAFTSQFLADRAARPRAWAFVKQHWEELHDKIVSFGGGGFVAALSAFCDAATARDVETFFATHRAPAAERAAQQSLESIRSCADLEERVGPALHAWLASR